MASLFDIRASGSMFALLLSCADRVAPDENGSEVGSGSDMTTAAAETTAASTSSESTTSTEGGIDSSTTESLPDVCALAESDACPAECRLVDSYSVDDLDSCAITTSTACVAGSPPLDAVARTYYRDDVFVMVGGYCGGAQAPDGWSECRFGADDDPPACACLCREDVCYGDEDRVALESCGVEQLCPLAGNDEVPKYDREVAICVLTALRDRTPGMVAASYSTGFDGEQTVAYLDGSDEVQIVQEDGDDFLACPVDASGWQDAKRCTLADPAVFDACIAGDDLTVSDCLLASANWFADCQPTEPSCG